ncbi:MAG: hypothetical protein FJX29_14080 [Alphaproteobacteria bacterium]|nr:hypothetical protein [Alphaproteobacteria bacterium]
MWWAGTKLVYETPFKIDGQTFSQLLNNAAQIIGVLIAAAMIVVTNSFNAKQNQSNARQQIYQTLETQSIELFRFEAQHPELVSAFWEPEEFARMDTSAMLLKAGSRSFQYQLRQYVCQMLNLFEMAFRFRRDEIAPADVFSSWIVWMWEVAAEPRFRELWPGPSGLHLNYIRDFSEVMTFAMERALQLPDAPAEDELNRARQDFADFASIRLGGCPELAGWFTGNSKPAAAPPVRLA